MSFFEFIPATMARPIGNESVAHFASKARTP